MKNSACAVALGKFDGIHIGHTKLIDATVDIASRFALKSMVYTISNDSSQTITDKNDKIDLLRMLGIEEVVFRDLNDGIKELMPEDFVEKILFRELNARWVVVGENFRFGKDRCADSQKLKEICKKYNIETYIIETVYTTFENVVPISSTLIRDCLRAGDVETVSVCLGRPFSVKGIVRDGKHLGRKLGFPTMNIDAGEGILLPKNGVYATRAVIDGKSYPSITNVGNNPTIDNLERARTETHILDKTVDCYGKNVVIEFLKFIRCEKIFENEKDLADNVKRDINKVNNYFKTSEVDSNDIQEGRNTHPGQC